MYSRHALRPRVFWKYGGFVLHNRALPQCFGLRSREVSEIKKKQIQYQVPGNETVFQQTVEFGLFLLLAGQWNEDSGDEVGVKVTQICLTYRFRNVHAQISTHAQVTKELS